MADKVRPKDQNTKWNELVNVACNLSKIEIPTSDNKVNENYTDYVTNNKGTEKTDPGNSDNNFNQSTMEIDIEYHNENQKGQSKPHAMTTIQSSSSQTIDTLIAQNITPPENNTLAGQDNVKDVKMVHNNQPKPIFKWVSKEEIQKMKRIKSFDKGTTYRRFGKHFHISDATLNTIAQINSFIGKNTLQAGYDKQDKEIANKVLPIIKPEQDLNKNNEFYLQSATVQTTQLINNINSRLGYALVSVTTDNPKEKFTYLCYVEHMTALGKGRNRMEAMDNAANHLYEEYVLGHSTAKFISKISMEQLDIEVNQND